VVFGDWTLGADGYSVPTGDHVIAQPAYRDANGGAETQTVNTHLFSVDGTDGNFHVFAIGFQQ
jgi:hypothetical protein